jgi:hypothetical protein
MDQVTQQNAALVEEGAAAAAALSEQALLLEQTAGRFQLPVSPRPHRVPTDAAGIARIRTNAVGIA